MLTSTQGHGAQKLSKVVLQTSLAEIAEIVSGFGFPKHLQGKTEGELPFFKVGDISRVWNHGQKLLTHAEHYLSSKEAEQIKTKVFPGGTVVFAKIGEAIKLNRRAILGQPSIVDNNVMGLIPRQGLVDTLYLYYYMLTVKLGDISQATTVPSVRKSDVESIVFPLVPIEAQKCIVAEIEKQFSRLDEAVANLKRVKANLKRYKAAVLKAAVEGKLTEDWRKQHPNVERASKLLERILGERRVVWEQQQLGIMRAVGKTPDNQSWRSKYQEPSPIEPGLLPPIPDSWTYASAESVCRSVRDGTHDTPGYVSDGVPLITSKNLLPSGLDFEHVKLISREDLSEIARRSGVEHGDVLFAMIGTIGNPVVVETDREFAIKNVGLFKGNHDFLVSRYLRYWFMSSQFTRWLEPKQKGTTQKFVPLGLLRSLAVVLPPFTEQQCIVNEVERRLSVIDELGTAVEANLTRANRLRQATLQKAFSGKLLLNGART